MIKKRNSSVELLRILSIFGIIMMHCFGEYYLTCTGCDLVFGIIINSLFNTGVSCFMLISGFFGLKFNINKLIKILFLVLFYSYIDLFIRFQFESSALTFAVVLKSLFPLFTGKYWYISCYIIIYILSDYINGFINQLSMKKFSFLLIVLLTFYYVAPTTLYFQLLNDSGKGIVNMFIIYLTGRYIRLYYNFSLRIGILITIYFVNLLLMFAFTFFVSSIHGGIGIKYPVMLRDNSIFIYINSVCLFLLFSKYNFYSSIVNMLASCVLGIYLNENIVRYVVNMNLKTSVANGIVAINIILVSILVFAISMIIEIFRKYWVNKFKLRRFDIGINNIITFVNNKRLKMLDYLKEAQYEADKKTE